MSKAPDPRLFLAMAVIALLIGGYFDYAQMGAIGEAEERVALVQADVDKAETLKKELASSEASIQDLQVKLAHLEKGVQSYQYIPTMMRELEQFGSSHGVKILGIKPIIVAAAAKPDEKLTRKPYDEITIELKGRGTYTDVLKFLSALQEFPQIVAVRTITLSPKTEDGKSAATSPNLDLTSEVKVFVFPDSTPAATPVAGSSSVASSGVNSNG